MQIGLTIFPTEYSIQPTDLAREAEARDFESLWLPEHSHIPASANLHGQAALSCQNTTAKHMIRSSPSALRQR